MYANFVHKSKKKMIIKADLYDLVDGIVALERHEHGKKPWRQLLVYNWQCEINKSKRKNFYTQTPTQPKEWNSSSPVTRLNP